ncbi:NAD(P)/FAD-dependent oxidoreductase [Paenibacillus chondroitinus]|uniref:Pyridine nucleotide-disulfide oxidoreductase domain-containing protein 2 n=1 Tax=Paenibacillus chondroitinus TaxID=59842 RepID=A0ABU6D7T6_9BACL|nr:MULTISPECIES: NAD(P)/FAD-dependent oxidoreductase [Paenibacillus]MCY9661734.1 NAD(P)/FAD-dependent oxidoreductase [Paenibacillus anseongense]MEB4793819.1 NAD(P)/FAD-dependent oxidoreductase [Paenibacillus chondroitinus]
METFDFVMIGSGHNALITAAYLTRAGRSVLVLEKNDRPGGFVRTEELTLPGFKHDVYAAAHPLFTTGPAYAELREDLEARGLRYVNADLPTGVSMEDGRTAVLSRSFEELIAEAERLAPGDGAALAGIFEQLNPHVNDVFGLFSMDLSSQEAAPILKRLLHDENSSGYSAFAGQLFGTARQAVNSLKSPVTRAMLASWVTHLGRTPDEVGSGIWVPLTAMALMGGGMPTPAGGSEQLVQALVRLIKDQGGEILTNTLAERILVENGRAVGVRTAEGRTYIAKQAVVASTTPDQLYLSLLAERDAPSALRSQAKQFRYGRGCVQIHLALSEPPRWPDARFDRVGQPHLTDGLDGFTLAIAQGMADLLPAKPTFTVDCSTNLDPTRAPEGKAIMRIQVLEVPTRPRGDAAGLIDVGDGSWTQDLTERFTERVLQVVSKHIPNIPSAIIGKYVVTPDVIARFNPNAGPGDPYGGAHDLAQSYLLRPLPGQPSHQTVIPNVYMLGAATWPGHGVNGGSGYIVAQQLLSRL